MPECKSPYNTPTRHDELSVTKISLRSRVLNPYKAPNENTNCDSLNKKEKVSREFNSIIRVNKAASVIKLKEEDSERIIWDTSSTKIDEKKSEITTCDEDMDSLSSDSGDRMETSVILDQKHSTPQVIKFLTKAASSTPNQDMFNVSKLTRNAFTQTPYTLNPKDEDDLADDLKSYCIEIPDYNSQNMLSCTPKSSFNTTSGLSSPLRNLCSSKLIQYDGTPVQKQQSVRKLSLRSKTMICSAMEKSKDVSKTFMRHKSMEEKRLFSNTFSLLPQPKTPPSCLEKVFHNPFEVDLQGRFSKSIFSPDVFDNVVSPSQDSEDLRWTIEDISSINPVPLDEDFTLPSDEEDPETESVVQQEIDRYFSETHVVLSPDDLPKPANIIEDKESHFHAAAVASTPRKVNLNFSGERKHSSSQTTLSLPMTLAVELEESLRSYFKCFEDDEFNLNMSTLRRKLFFHSEDEPPSPVRFEMFSSPITKDDWKTESSPFAIATKERHFTPVGRQEEMSSPEISPVVSDSPKLKNNSLMSCKKTLHHFFPDSCMPERKEGPVVNSTVLTAGCMDTSTLPSSQDTGYHTEDSVSSHLHFSTPTRIVQ